MWKSLDRKALHVLQVRRDEAVQDNFHGTEVKDPYRWLEDPDSAETSKCETFTPPLANRQDLVTMSIIRTIQADAERYTLSGSSFAVVTAQNSLTSGVLEECETRSKFKELMTELYNYPKYGCPYKRGGR